MSVLNRMREAMYWLLCNELADAEMLAHAIDCIDVMPEPELAKEIRAWRRMGDPEYQTVMTVCGLRGALPAYGL